MLHLSLLHCFADIGFKYALPKFTNLRARLPISVDIALLEQCCSRNWYISGKAVISTSEPSLDKVINFRIRQDRIFRFFLTFAYCYFEFYFGVTICLLLCWFYQLCCVKLLEYWSACEIWKETLICRPICIKIYS